MTDVPGLIRNIGCAGAALPRFGAHAWEMFHNATIFEGVHGLSIVNAPSTIVVPVGCGDPKRSPSYSTIRSSSNTPNPTRPSFERKRAQRVMVNAGSR